ncbi:type I methionyl aminopeptidase [Pseudomonadota bacterium]
MNQRVKAQIKGGKLLAKIKQELIDSIKPGIKLEHIDKQAEDLLRKTGGTPSFQMVPGYSWSTCINLNQGIVHGIPKGSIKSGDLVTLDIGLFYQGYHTDTSSSFFVGPTTPKNKKFLDTGKKVLAKSISVAKANNRVFDISEKIQQGIESAGYSVVRNLTGHGVGEQLHQDPAIPCFTQGSRSNSPILSADQAIAIEVMYCMGDWHTKIEADGWTISTQDEKLSAIFEETIIITNNKPIIATSIS